MPLNRDRMDQLQQQLIQTLEGKTPLLDVPFYICIYNPKDELDAIEDFSKLALRLKQKGYSVELLKLSDLMVEILEEEGFLEPEILQNEEQQREELDRDLRKILSEQIVEKLLHLLGQKPKSHCAILLRYGALWPFVRLSYIQQALTEKVTCTLAILYPSSIGEGHPLDQESDTTIPLYRGEKVYL